MDVESTMLPLGTKLPEFNLRGVDEKYYKNSDFCILRVRGALLKGY